MIVRTATAADAGPVRDFLSALSQESGFRRFFTGLGVPSGTLARRLVRRDADHGAWVAVDDGRVVGHASWARLPGAVEAEVAVVVADDRQRAGIGTELVVAAAEDAVRAGAEVLRFVVLGENRGVVDWLARLWPGLTPASADGMVVYEVVVGHAAPVALV